MKTARTNYPGPSNLEDVLSIITCTNGRGKSRKKSIRMNRNVYYSSFFKLTITTLSLYYIVGWSSFHATGISLYYMFDHAHVVVVVVVLVVSPCTVCTRRNAISWSTLMKRKPPSLTHILFSESIHPADLLLPSCLSPSLSLFLFPIKQIFMCIINIVVCCCNQWTDGWTDGQSDAQNCYTYHTKKQDLDGGKNKRKIHKLCFCTFLK